MNCNCAICKNNKPFEMPNDIVNAAIEGNLVLFCGAGISTENKIVMPYSFYSEIMNELELDDNTLSFSSLMQKYCNQPNGRRKLIKRIKERFDYIHSFPELEFQATRFHKELSQIYPIKTIVTTDWDTYFEDYCDAIPITSPEDFSLYDSDKRHVLKIHGSINNLSSIVATTDDYNHCYARLTNGVLGATLKTYLATKTVVFIGFSFGDDDFNQLMQYIRKEMGDFYPYFYIVTLDDTLKKRIEYKNSTCIVTAGTFFLHKLRLALIEKGNIRDCSQIINCIEYMKRIVQTTHINTSSIDKEVFPCVLYTLVYQDGVLHAFERFLEGNKNGEYCDPDFILSSINGYEDLILKVHTRKEYLNEAYYEGYLNGLVLIGCCKGDDNEELIKGFPILYLPGRKAPKTVKTYHKYLQKLSTSDNEYSKIAKEAISHLIDNNCNDDKNIVIHHPPF